MNTRESIPPGTGSETSGPAILRVPSSLISARHSTPLPPAAVSILWKIAEALTSSQYRNSLEETPGGTWICIPSKLLKPSGQRNNKWLIRCLRALSHCELAGYRDGQYWEGVLLAEWEPLRGGTEIRILLPPGAYGTMRDRSAYAQIEGAVLQKMPRMRHAQRLYAALADRRRMARKDWVFSLEEIRDLLDLHHQSQYRDWSRMREKVLVPALRAINGLGHIKVGMTPQRAGRYVTAVRLDWEWAETEEPPEEVPEVQEPPVAATAAAESQHTGDEQTIRAWWQSLNRRNRRHLSIHLGYSNRDVDLGDDSPIAAAAYRKDMELLDRARAQEERQALRLTAAAPGDSPDSAPQAARAPPDDPANGSDRSRGPPERASPGSARAAERSAGHDGTAAPELPLDGDNGPALRDEPDTGGGTPPDTAGGSGEESAVITEDLLIDEDQDHDLIGWLNAVGAPKERASTSETDA